MEEMEKEEEEQEFGWEKGGGEKKKETKQNKDYDKSRYESWVPNQNRHNGFLTKGKLIKWTQGVMIKTLGIQTK